MRPTFQQKSSGKVCLNEKTVKFLSLLKAWDITSDIFYKLSKQYTDQIT